MWPFSPSKPKLPSPRNDVFWLTDPAKIRGLITAASRALASGSHVLLITRSPDTFDRLTDSAAIAKLPLDGLQSPTTAPQLLAHLRARPSPTLLLAFDSSLAPSPAPPSGPSPSNPPALAILVAERFPLRASDDALLTYSAAIPASTIEFHLSIEDPLLQAFRGDSTEKILRSLGMTDSESITHPMLSRSISRAQQKIATQCPDHSQVESWLRNRGTT